MRSLLKHILRCLGLGRFARSMRSLSWAVCDALGGVFFHSPPAALPAPDTVGSILVIRRDALGDVVLSTPALRALRHAFPRARIDLFVTTYTRDLVVNNPNVDRVIVDEDQLLRGAYTIAVVLHPGFFVNRLAYKSKAAMRLGYAGRGGSFFLTSKIPDDRSRRMRHEVESALEVMAHLGCKTDDTRLEVSCTQEGQRFAEDFFKQHGLDGKIVAAIHPGARQQYIRWDAAGFAEVGKRLAARGTGVILIGGASEQGLVSRVASLMPEAPVKAVGFSIGQLISVLARCRLFIGNSSGPMHIAAALGVPVVALFGSRHPLDAPQAWHPWNVPYKVIAKDPGCPHCHPGDCRQFRCMERISADEVFAAASELLGRA